MSAKYKQLADALRSELSQIAARGEKFPTEAQLTERYHMSRQTVRHALQILKDEGLIERRQGSGSYIRESKAKTDPMQIAVITSFLDDYIFPAILQDAQSSFAKAGYSTLIFATENNVGKEREILTRLLSLGVSGVLVEGTKTALPTPNGDLYRKLRDRGVPIVFVHGIYSNLSDFVCVLDDNLGGGYMLTKYLLDKGHRKFSAIFKSDDLQGPARYQGMANALRDAAVALPDNSIFWYDTEDRRELLQVKQSQMLTWFIEKRMGEATAVVCYNDEIAYMLILALMEAGKRVPEDVAVVSFDNSNYSRMGPIPITSLSHTWENTGLVAADILLNMLSGGRGDSRVMKWELIQRQSG